MKITLPSGQTVIGTVKANGAKYINNGNDFSKSDTSKDSLDIAVIEFTIPKSNSASNFQAAKIGDDLKIGDKMLGVGTPFDSKEKRYSPGIVMDKTKSLSDGVTLVSDTQIKQGMSGGGVFGENGKLIGINCIGAFPIFQVPGSNGKIYNWPDHSGAGDIEASTLKRFLEKNKIEYSK